MAENNKKSQRENNWNIALIEAVFICASLNIECVYYTLKVWCFFEIENTQKTEEFVFRFASFNRRLCCLFIFKWFV